MYNKNIATNKNIFLESYTYKKYLEYPSSIIIYILMLLIRCINYIKNNIYVYNYESLIKSISSVFYYFALLLFK